MGTTAPPASAAGMTAMMGSITTVHLILIAILAALTVLMILWGVRLRARRKAAEAAAEDRREGTADHLPHAAPDAAVAAERASVAEPMPAPVSAPVLPPEPLPESVVPAPVEPVAAADGSDLTRLKGLGPRLVAQLAERGITSIAQIAALAPDEAAMLDTQLGSFNGRLSRDRWVEQAQLLAAGDTAGYEAAFGKL